MPVGKAEALRNIAEIEASIRAACSYPVEAKRFGGPIGPGIIEPKKKQMIEHALWYLQCAKEIAEGTESVEEEEANLANLTWCMAVASGLVLPYGIAAHYVLRPADGIHMALIAPAAVKK